MNKVTVKAYTIYNPGQPVQDLRLFRTKKEAEKEFNRIYPEAFRELLRTTGVGIKSVDIHV